MLVSLMVSFLLGLVFRVQFSVFRIQGSERVVLRSWFYVRRCRDPRRRYSVPGFPEH